MKSCCFIYNSLVSASLMFCLAGCGVKAHRQAPPIPKGDPTTVRFAAELTQAPQLYSRGSYVDEQHAWVAASAEVKRTVDGGRTWQLMRPSTEDESVFGKMGGTSVMPSFIIPTRGWLNASKGIWQTEDGGSTWRQIFSEDTGNPHFADKQHGWIAIYKDKYQESYVTKDGGSSWQPCGAKRRLDQQTPNQVFFLTPQHGWAITSYTDDERRTIYGVAETTDGGCSWRQVWTSDEDPDEMYCQLFFLNEKEGWLSGCYSAGSLIETKDGGKTWHRVQTPTEAWRATPIEVYFANSAQGWIITKATQTGNQEGVYRTNDGGRDWKQLTDGEIRSGFGTDTGRGEIPANWNGGKLFQMLYVNGGINQLSTR